MWHSGFIALKRYAIRTTEVARCISVMNVHCFTGTGIVCSVLFGRYFSIFWFQGTLFRTHSYGFQEFKEKQFEVKTM